MMPVPIPARMGHLPRDRRGYPEPVILMRDEQGKAYFTLNDSAKVATVTLAKGCHICGGALRRPWLVGGPLSAYHPRGGYNDGPLHRECMEYAMQVCPHLAHRVSGKAIGPKVAEQLSENIIARDLTTMPGVPALFVCIRPQDYTVRWERSEAGLNPVFLAHQPYDAVQFWYAGHRLTDEEGRRRVAIALMEYRERAQ